MPNKIVSRDWTVIIPGPNEDEPDIGLRFASREKAIETFWMQVGFWIENEPEFDADVDHDAWFDHLAAMPGTSCGGIEDHSEDDCFCRSCTGKALDQLRERAESRGDSHEQAVQAILGELAKEFGKINRERQVRQQMAAMSSMPPDLRGLLGM